MNMSIACECWRAANLKKLREQAEKLGVLNKYFNAWVVGQFEANLGHPGDKLGEADVAYTRD